MARYIDADKLIAEYDRVHIGPPGRARKIMEEAPTADVAEVKHGEWIYKPSSDTLGGTDATYDWMCSGCKDTSVDDTKFCPNCGAKMDGGRQNDGKG